MNIRIQAGPKALTRVEVLVIIALVVVLLGLLLPALGPGHPTHKTHCANNLKQVGLAYRIWADDNGDQYPMQVSLTNGGTMEWATSGMAWPHFQVVSNELNTPKVLVCPEDKPRMKALNEIIDPLRARGVFGLGFSPDRRFPLSYFISLDVREPTTTMPLAGDDNLAVGGKRIPSGLWNLWTNSPARWTGERHGKAGYICMADGSVQQVSNEQLRQKLAGSGVATNRLAIP